MKIYNTELDKRRELNLCEITGTNLWPRSTSSFRKVLEKPTYSVTDRIWLQTVSGYRLYPVIDGIRLQTVSGYRLYPVIYGIRLQTGNSENCLFLKRKLKISILDVPFFYFDFIYWEFIIWHTGLYNTVKLRFVGRKPSMFWLYDPSQPKHQSNQDSLL